MTVLRIKLYQDFACYRKPMTYGFWETYPLPPLSTVKGFFHSVIQAKEYIPAKYSIQGKFKSIVLDLQSMFKFDRNNSEAKNNSNYLGFIEGFNKPLKKSPIYVSNLYAVELTIYINAEQEHLDKFMQNIEKIEFPSLGRKEDLVRVDDVNIVELTERDLLEKSYQINNGIYLSKEKANELGIKGINYRMNFYYESKDNIRLFKKKEVVYVDNKTLYTGSILYDEEEDKVVDLIGD